jgi:hypothetical protein
MERLVKTRVSKGVPKPLWASVVLCVLFVSLGMATVGLAGKWWIKKKADRVRAEWLQNTIRELSGVSKTDQLIAQEIAEMSGTNVSRFASSRWINEHVLVFTNGEVLIYSQKHGGGWFGGHVLLGRDQPGRWFYSAYHFCNKMAMISGDRQPGSIEEFSKIYSLREFDGTVPDVTRKRVPTPPGSRTRRNEAQLELQFDDQPGRLTDGR